MDPNSHHRQYTIKYNHKMQKMYTVLKEHFNINYFYYQILSSDGKCSIITCDPKYAEFYLANKCYLADPFLRHPSNFNEGTVFWSSMTQPCEEKLRDTMREHFNVDHGIELIQKSDNPNYDYEFFGFTAPTHHKEITNIFVNEIDLFRKFCHYFRAEMSQILRKMQENPVNMGELKGEKFFEINPVGFRLPTERRTDLEQNFLSTTHSLINGKPELLLPLSQRERECLALYVQGKSAAGTAEILGLSYRTIEHYIESIKNKLNCDKKSDILGLFYSKESSLSVRA